MRTTLVALLIAAPALAHEAPTGWQYDRACCSDQDCGPTTVESTAHGYRVLGNFLHPDHVEVVPFHDYRIRSSGDGAFHACIRGGGVDYGEPSEPRVICLYVPMVM